MAIWQDLVDDHGFTRPLPERQALRPQAARQPHTPKPARSSSPRRAKKRRSTTATAPWCAIRSTGKLSPHALVRVDAGLQPEIASGCSRSAPAREPGPSCTSKPSAGSAARRASWCSTTCAKACSSPTSTIPRSIRCIAMCSTHYGAVALPCRVARSRSQRQGRIRRRPRARRRRSKGMRFESSGRGASLSGPLGRALGRHAHPRHHQAPGGGHVRRREAGACCRCRSSRSAITSTANAAVHLDGCVEVEAAYYSAPPGWIGRRRQRAVGWPSVRLLDPQTGPSAARALAPAAWRAIAFRTEDQPSRRRRCTTAATAGALRQQPARTSARFCQSDVSRNDGAAGDPAHSRHCRLGEANTAWRRRRCLRRRVGVRASRQRLSFRPPLSRATGRNCTLSPGRSTHPPADAVSRLSSTSKNTRRNTPNESHRTAAHALRQLRLGGMAAVLETRLRQAQAEPMAPIDLISLLWSPTNSPAARTGCWSAAANRPPFAIPTRRSTTSTSPSIRR